MWYVYILKSAKIAKWIYVGSTNQLARRLREHFEGKCVSTKPYLPVRVNAYIAVSSEAKAKSLEKYLKTGSGKAILKKRILSDEALA